MENKSKVFTKKLVALFLAVVMAVACFSGVISASAYSKGGYHDANLSDAYNYLTWTEPTSNQTAEALLDLADRAIGDLNIDLNAELSGHYVVFNFDVKIHWPEIYVDLEGDKIDVCVESIDDVINLLCQASDLLHGKTLNRDVVVNLLGDIPSLKPVVRSLASTNDSNSAFHYGNAQLVKTETGPYSGESRKRYSWRNVTNAPDIIGRVINFVATLINSDAGKSLLSGTFSLGNAVQDIVLKKQTLYDIIKGALGAWDGYQSNLAYNIVAALMFNNTDWFADEEVAGYKADMATFKFEDVLLQKLSTEVLQKISVLVTYPNLVNYTSEYPAGTDENGNPITGYFKDSSARRIFYINKAIEEQELWEAENPYQAACAYINNYIANNPNGIYGNGYYDANLVYSTENGMENNVLLFQYTGVNSFAVKKEDTLYSLAIPALRLAWKTAIAPTLGLVQPNFAGFETDYDNAFYQWQSSHGGWNKSNLAANYASANVEAWAADVYADYEAADAAAFLAKVEEFYTGLDRAAVAASEAKYNWRDMDVTTLFNKLRYSPLADKYFNVQTGPLNLYLMQTGYPNIEAFLEANVYNRNTYNGLVEGIYDFLMAAMADLFPSSNNIAGSVPSLTAIGNNKTNAQIASALVSKAAEIFEYAANATDLNILSPFYHEYGSTAHISESNFEAAVIPMAIAILKQWNLTEPIHDSMWDRAKDFEGLAAIALNEYLSFVFPSRDYTTLWEYDATDKHIKAKSGNMMDNVLLPMVRDALGYVLTAEGVPLYKPAGSHASWNPYTDSYVADAKNGVSASQVERSTSLWDLANGVLCYYATEENFDTSSGPMASPGKGMAAVFGLQGQIKTSNTLWVNLNLIANRILPALGKLQGNNYGAFDSYDLFYNKIVTGLVDMDKNGGGLTNFATQFLTICKAEPITSHGIVRALYYDLLAPFVNALINRSTTNGKIFDDYASYNNLANYNKTYPFDALLQKSELISKLGTVANRAADKLASSNTGLWKTISYVLTAINAIPELKVHYAGGVSARFPSNVIYNSSSINTTLTIRNESFGLNKFYRLFGGLDITSMGDIRESGRYYVIIRNISAEVEGSNGSTSAANFSYGDYRNVEIAPEKDKAVSVNGSVTPGKVYTFNVTYDVYVDKDITDNNNTKQQVQSGLVAKEYLYIAPSGTQAAGDTWDSEVYGSGFGGMRPFWEDINPENDVVRDTHIAGVGASNAWTRSTSATGGFYATVPVKYIVDANYPRGAHNRGYRVYNTNNAASRVNSIYAYPTQGYKYYNVASGAIAEGLTTVSSDTAAQSKIFVAVSRNGALLNNEGNVAASLEEAVANGYISGISYTEDNDGNRTYQAALSSLDIIGDLDLKLATPASGVYLEARTGSDDDIVKAGSYKDFALLDWNSAATDEGSYSFNLALKLGNNTIRVTKVLFDAIGDYGALTNTIDNYTNILASYTASDFGSAAEYNALRAAITDAVKATAESKVTYNNVATFTTLDAKRAAIENAYKAATITGDLGQKVYNQVIKPRQDLVDADYNLFAFRSMETAAWDTEWFVGSSEPLKDANGETLYDEQGRTLHTYFTMTSKAMIDNRINLFNDALIQLNEYSKRGYNGNKIEAEVIHATSITDEYDDVIAATAHENTLDMIVSEDTSRQAYRFAYSTLDPKVKDDVTPYKVRIDYNGANMKFGRVDANRYLVNEDAEGNPIYTEKSWYAYVDALGECLNAIKTKQPISKTYNATKHLVIAENHLEKLPEVPVVGDGIAISGTVTIARDVNGDTYGKGIDGLTVSANGAESVLTAADGSFTIYVPAGTTAITVSGADSIPRTVSLSGTQAITDAIIPVCICDYNHDGDVDGTDFAKFNLYYNQDYYKYCDYNVDGVVDGTDYGGFNLFYGKPVSYTPISLD